MTLLHLFRALASGSRARRFAADEECVERPFVCYTYEWLAAKGLPHDRPAAFEKKCTPCPLAPCTEPETFAPKGVIWPKVTCDPTAFFCDQFPTERNTVQPKCTMPVVFEDKMDGGGGKQKHVLLPFNVCTREMLAKGTCPVELLESNVPAELKTISDAVPATCVNACIYKEKGSSADYAECQVLDIVDRQHETDIKIYVLDRQMSGPYASLMSAAESLKYAGKEETTADDTSKPPSTEPNSRARRDEEPAANQDYKYPRCVEAKDLQELCTTEPTSPPPTVPEGSNGPDYLIPALAVGGAALVVVIAFLIWLFCCKGRGGGKKPVSAEDPAPTPSPDGVSTDEQTPASTKAASEKDGSVAEAASPASTAETPKDGPGAGDAKQARGNATVTDRAKPSPSSIARGAYEDWIALGPKRILAKFAEFKTGTMTEIARSHDACTQNPKKNRYKDTKCLDKGRVRLRGRPDKNDYIHANYVTTAKGSDNMILTQGPLPAKKNKDETEKPETGTCEDFWRMCVEQGVQVILQLCDFYESGMPKCAKYFPDHKNEPMQIGVYTVTLIRPIVIHCSAGIGRSGVAAVIQYVLHAIECGVPFTNLLDIIKEMRKERAKLVQTPEQYLYVHMVLLKLFRAMGLLDESCDDDIAKFEKDYIELMANPTN
ncbi:unnamed protein product, partial [Mesorhabditis spiculigera]